VGVLLGVREVLGVGVLLGVREVLGVGVGVRELLGVGVMEVLGVTEVLGVGVGVGVGVRELLGVTEGLSVGVTVTKNPFDSAPSKNGLITMSVDALKIDLKTLLRVNSSASLWLSTSGVGSSCLWSSSENKPWSLFLFI
ncbi:MAG: hypothetical protein NWR72_13090, partial [Bacteroidia bacterium]|nr:hypothetical protein [Bacteroidia bacterium]